MDRPGVASTLLKLKNRPTAILSSNDDMAAAVVAVAHGMGLRVPGDLSVTGFDDTPVATTIWPTLTTIHQPVTAMGRTAVRLMLEEIRCKRSGERPIDSGLAEGRAGVALAADGVAWTFMEPPEFLVSY